MLLLLFNQPASSLITFTPPVIINTPPPSISSNALYPRTIEVHRVKTGPANRVIGPIRYSGAVATTSLSEPAGEIVLFTGVIASIQAGTTGRKKDSALPGDVVFMPTWNIFCPLSALARGSVRDRDIVVDDEGYRYEVGQAYWNILGYKLVCIRLEA